MRNRTLSPYEEEGGLCATGPSLPKENQEDYAQQDSLP